MRRFIVGIGESAKHSTGFDGFTIPEDEAQTASEPAARMMQRNLELAERIEKLLDPVALIVAAFVITVPRFLAYNVWRDLVADQLRRQQQREAAKSNGAMGETTTFTDAGDHVNVNQNPFTDYFKGS